MPTVTTTQQWKLTRLGSNQVQAATRMGVFLAAIGDILIVESSFIEQLQSVASIGQSISGATATRTFTIEFRHSVNNTTWTAWTAWTLPNAQAITYDADLTNYFQHRITRTGSDVTGLLEVQTILLGFVEDPSAVSGHGKFTTWGIRDESAIFLKAIIETVTIQYAGRSSWQVLHFDERQTSGTVGNVILIDKISTNTGDTSQISSDLYPISCNILVKMSGNNLGNNQGFASEQAQMAGILLDVFRSRSWAGNRFTFAFKNVSFVAVPLSVIGCQSFTINDAGTVYIDRVDAKYTRLELKFTIFANRKQLGVNYG